MDNDERGFVRDLVVACNELVNDWAEGDEAVKQKLWFNMATALRDYCTEYGWPAQWKDEGPDAGRIMALLRKSVSPKLLAEIDRRLSDARFREQEGK